MSSQAHLGALKNGATTSDRHVGSTGSHRDASTELDLDGAASRSTS